MTHLEGKLAEERMLEEAKRFILASGEFRTVPDLAKLLRVDRHSLDRQLNAWRDCGKIFSIPGGAEGELFPLFAFDPDRGLQVFDAVHRILQIFGDKLSPWAIAGWFIAACSYLDDQSPKDLVAEDPDWVIAAARDEIDEVSHG
jgi:hypothetical protein